MFSCVCGSEQRQKIQAIKQQRAANVELQPKMLATHEKQLSAKAEPVLLLSKSLKRRAQEERIARFCHLGNGLHNGGLPW